MRDVVIAGGGFGGYYAAKKRRAPGAQGRPDHLDQRRQLVDVQRRSLPGAAASTLDPRHVVVRRCCASTFTGPSCGWGGCSAASLLRNLLKVKMISGETIDYSYDQLIVALGSVSRTFPIPGLVEHAIGFKTIAEATALCNRVVRYLELAEGARRPRSAQAIPVVPVRRRRLRRPRGLAFLA